MKAIIYAAVFLYFGVSGVDAQVNLADYNAFHVRSDFEIYPNSADDKVTFESPVNYDWEIVNQQGLIQMKGKALAGKNPLEIYGLPPGTYFVRFVTDGGAIVRQLIVR